MIKLYGHADFGNCYKIKLTLNQLEIKHERVKVDIFKGKKNEPLFVELNPNKKIPLLIDGDLIIWRSNCILLYLVRNFPPIIFILKTWRFTER